MPTLQERIRKTVLENAHLPESQIAELAGITVRAVMRILDSVEAPPRPEPAVQQVKKVALPRSSQRSGVKYKVQTPPRLRAKRMEADQTVTGVSKRLTNHNGLPPAGHGTESGYSRHQRHKEEACDPCKEAMRLRAVRRRAKQKQLTVS